ncbi:N-formylglutamate deformylase [Ruegeria denitrificans]|uniref:N-formylglutamate deformylase n=1 Tax=Ruegeria denitrificans TaxID=1715692 RepID=A0A0P1J0A6_9RHOB|nr:N-formylglutamate deformylase [Ruegeria denitrificans]CUK19247.1 N-formylglutamate deformylase [Ruegeria denitrificans]
MQVVSVHRGDGPIVLGQPHGGTYVPDDIATRFNNTGRALADTDWHINRLYTGLIGGVTVVQSHVHRYVIDANRDPEGLSLYPGQNTTTLVPLTDFDGQSIWQSGQEPSEDEIGQRRETFHAPYHAALTEELERVRAIHGVAVLFDCHSIRSHIPFLFEGTLFDMNIGTDGGVTCASGIESIANEFATSSPYSTILNGRFRGGWTTRHYGRPHEGLHAIQMELAQSTYLSAESPPWPYDPAKADRLRHWLHDILEAIQDTALETTP